MAGPHAWDVSTPRSTRRYCRVWVLKLLLYTVSVAANIRQSGIRNLHTILLVKSRDMSVSPAVLDLDWQILYLLMHVARPIVDTFDAILSLSYGAQIAKSAFMHQHPNASQ